MGPGRIGAGSRRAGLRNALMVQGGWLSGAAGRAMLSLGPGAFDPTRSANEDARRASRAPFCVSAMGERDGKAQHQRQDPRRAGGGRHAAALGDPRAGRPHRHQIRLRRRAVRRLLGAHQWRGGRSCSIPVGSSRRPTRSSRSRACRRHSSHPVQKAWAGARRAAMRLLPVGADHGGRGAAREESRIPPTRTSTTR